jgi:hypothetical protein
VRLDLFARGRVQCRDHTVAFAGNVHDVAGDERAERISVPRLQRAQHYLILIAKHGHAAARGPAGKTQQVSQCIGRLPADLDDHIARPHSQRSSPDEVKLMFFLSSPLNPFAEIERVYWPKDVQESERSVGIGANGLRLTGRVQGELDRCAGNHGIARIRNGSVDDAGDFLTTGWERQQREENGEEARRITESGELNVMRHVRSFTDFRLWKERVNFP